MGEELGGPHSALHTELFPAHTRGYLGCENPTADTRAAQQ